MSSSSCSAPRWLHPAPPRVAAPLRNKVAESNGQRRAQRVAGAIGVFAQTFREASHSSHVQWALGEVDVASLRSVFVQQRRDAQGRGLIGGIGHNGG